MCIRQAAGVANRRGASAAAGKTKQDSRELYLLIEGPGWGAVIDCPPDQGARARRFAQAINVGAHGAALAERQRGERIGDWSKKLEMAEGDWEAVRAAETALAEARGDNVTTRTREQQLRDALAACSEHETRAVRRAQKALETQLA